MKTVFRTLLFLAQCMTLGLAAAFVASVVSPSLVERVRHVFVPTETAAPEPRAAAESTAPAHPAPVAEPARGADLVTVSYASAVTRAAPAVVSIYANKIVSTRAQVLVPTNPLLQRLFPGIVIGPQKKRLQSLGSGVIVGTDGYVITNNHVIQGAEEIETVLYDGRTTQARVIGSDAETDLAVLKIDAPNLPAIAIADKTPLNVGDVVLAIGNPFGLSRTVTMGIVSALGRQLKRATYEDFIQTDAAINEGNSGGALVNAYGELVGINSNLFSPSAGNVGIGFAIPVATAKAVLDQIIAHGRVIRGWLGAEYTDAATTPQFPCPERAVCVAGVYENGPAALAGLRAGDVIAALDGEPVTNQVELRNREANLTPGTTVQLTVQRDGQPLQLAVTLAERPQRAANG
jgi:serine protease DegS/serine protease DegQ